MSLDSQDSCGTSDSSAQFSSVRVAVGAIVLCAGCFPSTVVPDGYVAEVRQETRVLICDRGRADVVAELRAELEAHTTSVEIEPAGCLQATKAAGALKRSCEQQLDDCALPEFIDGVALATATKRHDLVVMTMHLTRCTRTDTKYSPRKPDFGLFGNGGGGAPGALVYGGIALLLSLATKNSDSVQQVVDSPTMCGPLYLFDSAHGRVLGVRSLRDASTATVAQVALELMRSSAAR